VIPADIGGPEGDLHPPRIAVIGTLDTKGPEIGYVRDRLRGLGVEPIVIDSGILGTPVEIEPDISREEVALAGGHTLAQAHAAGSRGAAVEIMQAGVRAVCLRLWSEHLLSGVLCLGGAEGAQLGAAGMHALPLGVPKVILSPSASGRRQFAAFVGESDVVVMHSVVDIIGLNPIARSAYDNAVGAIVGMVRTAGQPIGAMRASTVGVTMLGQTTPGVGRLYAELVAAGFEPVVFHANGVGGPAMERLAEQGALAGIVDYTLSELANSVMDGIHATGPDRLRVAGRVGLPQVVVPGCADFFNQGAPVDDQYRDRPLYYHNPTATLVRLSHQEMERLGRIVAERLNEAKGPVVVIAPTRGFSLAGTSGGALYDPEGDGLFISTLAQELRPDIKLERIDADVNQTEFATTVAKRFVELMGGPHVQ
jgi:uncharacterized protein (UPF0261 family)